MTENNRVEHVGEDLGAKSDRPEQAGIGARLFRTNFYTACQVFSLCDPKNGAKDSVLTAAKEYGDGY